MAAPAASTQYSIPSQQCAVQRIEGTKRLSLRGHFITCVSCGEGQGRLVAQSVLVLPTPPADRARLTSSKFVAPVIIPLSFKPCPRVCVIPQILENSRTNMLFFRGYNDEVSNRACEGMAPYWVHPELSCVTPVVDSPPPLTPPVGASPMLPWFHSRRQQEAGITFPSPFRHPKSTHHNVMQELLV